LRARQQYLFENLKKETAQLDKEIMKLVEEAWLEFANQKLKKLDSALVKLATEDWSEFKQKMTPEEVAKAVILDEKFKMIYSALVRYTLHLYGMRVILTLISNRMFLILLLKTPELN
jgi:cysteinyl-tRNA synthetase